MAWKRVQPTMEPKYRSIVDPYSYWVLGPGLQDFQLSSVEEQRIPVLLRRKTEQWTEEAWALWRDAAESPDMPERPPHDVEPFDIRFLTLPKTRQLIEGREHERLFEDLERFTLGPPLPSSSFAPPGKKRSARFNPHRQG